jgi:hypothetical protein
MLPSAPAWFAADNVFESRSGWFIGSPTGFSVGPYPDRTHAERHSQSLMSRLARCADTTEVVRVVRRFFHDQHHKHGRQLRTGSSRAELADGANLPPVRSGENRRVWFRTNRFFSVADGWYFTTREAMEVGPYVTRADAEADAQRLLDVLRVTPTAAERRLVIKLFARRLAGKDPNP